MCLINQRRLLHLNSGSARAVGAWVLLVPRGGLSVDGWGTTTMVENSRERAWRKNQSLVLFIRLLLKSYTLKGVE